MNAKEHAATAAALHVESNTTIGLGTGSTANCFVEALGRLLEQGVIQSIRGVATSIRTARLAEELHIPIVSLEEAPVLDAVFDGADEIDPAGNMIKGGGGSLLREKIVAQVAKKKVVIVDTSKCVDVLGTTFSLPVEVVPFGANTHFDFFRSLGGDPAIRLNADGSQFLTDESNYTVDINFRPGGILDPNEMGRRILARVGIVEIGLFLGMADLVVIGSESGAETRQISSPN